MAEDQENRPPTQHFGFSMRRDELALLREEIASLRRLIESRLPPGLGGDVNAHRVPSDA